MRGEGGSVLLFGWVWTRLRRVVNRARRIGLILAASAVILAVLLYPITIFLLLVDGLTFAARKIGRVRVLPAGATWAGSLLAVLTATAVAIGGNPPPPSPNSSPSPTELAAASASDPPSPSPAPTSTASPSPAPTVTPSPTFGPIRATEQALVTRVVDGDTIEVEIDGALFKLRYIGIDSPETVDPSSPVQWMGPEASAANAALVDGRTVYLERDVSETDRYGRLLRYVWLIEPTGWLLVNLELVSSGFAAASSYPPDVKYQDLFTEAQREASLAGLGLWGPQPSPTPAPTAKPTPKPTPQPTAAPTTSGDCDPSYPTVCIPPPPPDLDCGQISYRNFTVIGDDPHRFDGDNDGIGCET